DELLHLFTGEGGGFELLLTHLGRRLHHVAQFAVHLHGDFQRVLDQQGRIELWPARVAQCGVRSAECGMKFVPQFFSKVRRERREQLKKRAHRRRRLGFPRHCLVDEDHERGYGGVKTERSEEHTSELQSRFDLVCRLLLEKKKNKNYK